MSRFNQLVEELGKKSPEDWWIERRRESERLTPNAFPQVEIYENALRRLDEQSWLVLSEKARRAFTEPRTDCGKYKFFNLLNEALAYDYLVEQGFGNVRLLRAALKKKTPDISYESDGGIRYREVKTIGVSDEELARKRSGEPFDGSIYSELSQQFLGKLGSTIQAADAQIQAVSGVGLVYLILHFDDFVLNHYDTYERQIAEFLTSQ